MDPTTTENHLPAVLRDSKLPWKPVWDDQAAAPRDGDSWKATLGHFRLELDAHDYSCFGSPPGLTYSLRLIYALYDREHSSWDLDKLQDAVLIAESAHQMLLDALLRELHSARKALHDAA